MEGLAEVFVGLRFWCLGGWLVEFLGLEISRLSLRGATLINLPRTLNPESCVAHPALSTGNLEPQPGTYGMLWPDTSRVRLPGNIPCITAPRGLYPPYSYCKELLAVSKDNGMDPDIRAAKAKGVC